MNLMIAWMIAITSPAASDYLFMSKVFNSEDECQAVVARIEPEKPMQVTCEKVGVWVPKKPTDV